MKIYSALQIGEYHQNHCEDYLFIGNIGEDKILCAVMDGCTMATDSYFISTLVGKLLRKISQGKSYGELYQPSSSQINIDSYLKSIVKELFSELNITKNQLLLEKKELLTTLILLLVDKKKNQGIVLVIGDGLVSINGTLTEFDHDNTPDYLGFHLQEDFESWYNSQKQKIIFENIQDVSIATDGIFSFTPVTKKDSAETIDPIDFLITDKTNMENEDVMSFKLKKLQYEFGLKPTDDLALVRIVI
jgi:hypothetical protein